MGDKTNSRMNVQLKRWLITLMPILALVGYVIQSEVAYARLKDPAGIATVADFYKRFGNSRGATVILVSGSEYIELTGPLPAGWSLAFPSSPPAYVFDASGSFIAWCSDPGDTPTWRRRWPVVNGSALSDEEVQQRFKMK